ncbi:NADH-dependent flavin oxidoreductase [Dyadobacter psychrotolerans]|nr:NADH-dependent flavin oxidoreductase [Dyadobacter psychrotolerans]
MNKQTNPIFKPFTFNKGITLKNKVAMAPMTTWASNDNYTISADEERHYKARVNGVGIVITGCSHVTPSGIGFTDEFASYDDTFLPSLKKLATVAKSGGAPAILQIFHAGNKALAQLIPDGDLVSASAIEAGESSFVSEVNIPRALSHEEILDIIKAFGQTTRRAIEAGFDGVELHGAHGFLIQNFFSPLFNQRTDEWGGSSQNRMRFALEVVKEVQAVIAEHATRPFLLGYRISPEESHPESYKLKDIFPLIDRLIELKVDYLHASLANVLESRPIGTSEGKTIAQLILDYVSGRIPVIAAGQIKNPEQAARAVDMGLAFVAIGQALVINPNWVELAARGEKIADSLSISKLPELAIPTKLWNVIDAAKGWFPISN